MLRNCRILALFLVFGTSSGNASFDEQAGCGFTKAPARLAEEYCGLFELNALAAKEAAVQAARNECKHFYTFAAEGINLMCSYVVEAELLANRMQSEQAEAEKGQKNSFTGAQQVHGEAEKFRENFLNVLEKKYNGLEPKNKAYHDKLRDLVGLGGRNFANESVCLTPPAMAPALTLTGLGLLAHTDRNVTYKKLRKAMEDMANALDQAGKSEKELSKKTAKSESSISGVLPEQKTEVPIANRGPVGMEREQPSSLGYHLLMRNVSTAVNSRVVRPVYQFYFPGAPNTWKASVSKFGGRLAGMEVSLAARLWKKGQLDYLDVISTAASILGGSPARTHIVTTVAQMAEWTTRRAQYDSYVGRVYAEFSEKKLKENPGYSSRALSHEFAKATTGKHKQADHCLATRE